MQFDPVTQMEEYRQNLIRECEEGIRKTRQIDVSVLNMGLTNQCNIHCVMCPFISKDTEYRTYFNAPPHMVTLKEFQKTLGASKKFPFRDTRKSEKKIAFNFFKGETLLNPELFSILQFIKETYPKSEIVILSNGTIPPSDPRITRYIDILGFSLDGGTQEVFEKIRTPAQFQHVIDSIGEWMKARNQYNPTMLLRTSTTLSTLNFHDLPNIVKTVGKLQKKYGKWDSIYCQPVIIEDYQDPALKEITLDHIDKASGKKTLEQTLKLAAKYGIRLDIPQAIFEFFKSTAQPQETKRYAETVSNPERFCEKLSNGYLSYDLDGRIEFACCFMDKKYQRELIERYHIPDFKSPQNIYNSRGYWQMRKDLLEGKLKTECRNCMIGKSNCYRIIKEAIEKDNERIRE